MNLDRFTDLLDIYGADPQLWPARERAAADALLAVSPDARELQHAALRFDNHLLNAALPELEPSDALRARIFAQMAAMPAASAAAPGWRIQITEALSLLFPAGRAMPQLAALALALFIGIGAGLSNFSLIDTQEAELVAVQLASTAPLVYEE
ncbi:hypothetical protein [Ferrovibrio sp.]|uniref:hypothetical protein n=1 Tax=Ferrovibrio sp. TaxID=1917215 RepID=UPI00262B0BEF|nr:hypothetical protein [Ferrovibrio sp.]